MRNVIFSVKTVEAIKKMEELAAVADQKRKNGEPYAEDGGALKMAQQAAKDANKSIIEDAFAEFKPMTREEAFMSYMKDFSVPAFAVKDDKEAGVIVSTQDAKGNPLVERLSFSGLEKVRKDCGAVNFRYMIRVLIDNCVQNWCKADGNASVKALPSEVLNFRANLGEVWLNKKHAPRIGKDDLCKQFDQIVEVVAPESFAKVHKARTSAIRDLTTSAMKYKIAKTNGDGMFVLGADSELEILFFDALFNIMEKRSVKVENSYVYKDSEGQPGNGDKPADADSAPVSVEETAEEETATAEKE